MEPLSDKSGVEETVAEVSRSVVLQLQMLLRMTPLMMYNKIQILDDVSTVVPDPATWPLTRNSTITDHIITTGPVQIHIDNCPKGEISLILISQKTCKQ